MLTDESSDLVNDKNEREGFKVNDWLVELKATRRDYAAMTPLQARTASSNKALYALIVVPLDGTEVDLLYIQRNAKIILNIGQKIELIIPTYEDVETKKVNLGVGREGISVSIEDQKVRFRISSALWLTNSMTIEQFLLATFKA